jgi:hypothetical protein
VTKRRLVWIAAGLSGALAIAGMVWSSFGTSRIVLTDTRLQERFNPGLPRQVKGVTIERATIKIAENHIALTIDVRASALNQTFAAAVFARGIPRLDAERGELFFDADDVKLENITIGNSEGNADQSGGRLGGLMAKNLKGIKAVASSVIASGVKGYLAARPVYRVKDDLKGLVLKSTVTGLTIEGNAVAISLSLLSVSVMVALCLSALLAVLAGIVYLVRHQSWGVRMQA